MSFKEVIGKGAADLLEMLEEGGKGHRIAISEGNALGPTAVIDGKRVINTGSLNILGIGLEKSLRAVVRRNVEKYGFGCTSTLSLCQPDVHLKLEESLAGFKGEDVLILGTGFVTSASTIKLLATNHAAFGVPMKKKFRRATRFYMDHNTHASMQGPAKAYNDSQKCKSGRGSLSLYRHRDYAMLEELLERDRKESESEAVIVGDSLYSMNGTFPDFGELIRIAKKYDAVLVTDGAHSDGIYGPQGRGVLEMQGIPREDFQRVIQIGTLSKAMSSIGGYVTLPKSMIELMKIALPEHMFTVGRPTFLEATDIFILSLVMGDLGDERREKLGRSSGYLRDSLTNRGFNIMDSKSHIVPVVLDDESACFKVKELFFDKHDIFVNPIPFPVIGKGASLIRISVTAMHTQEQLDRIVAGFVDAREQGFKFREFR